MNVKIKYLTESYLSFKIFQKTSDRNVSKTKQKTNIFANKKYLLIIYFNIFYI